jgi:lipid A 3-O-deacylase
MRHTTACVRTFLFAGCLFVSLGAGAGPSDEKNGVYIDFGRTPNGSNNTDSLTAGYVMPALMAPRPMWGGVMTFYWDFFLSAWRGPLPPTGADKKTYAQIGGIGNFRYRFGEGQSPWFVEAGLGGTLMDTLYRTPDREFTTAFQFTEQLSVGRSFGAAGEHELSLRFQHFSNGGIKEPNPGENFVRVRYLYRF